MPKGENASGADAWMPEESAYEGRDANRDRGNQVPVTPSSERHHGSGGGRSEPSEEHRREGGGAPQERSDRNDS